MANQPDQRRWSPKVAVGLLLTAVGFVVISFLTLGAESRFFSVLFCSIVISYTVGRAFNQDHSSSCGLGWICAVFAGTLYLTYLYPLIEKDHHDLSSIIAGVNAALIFGSVVSFLFWLTGRLIGR